MSKKGHAKATATMLKKCHRIAEWLTTKGHSSAPELPPKDVCNLAYGEFGLRQNAKGSVGSLNHHLSYIIRLINGNEPRHRPTRPPRVKPSLTLVHSTDPIVHNDPRIKAFYKSFEWKRLSYQTKLRCGRRCMCCGKKPAPDNDVELHSDHIKPIRRYWHLRLDPSNVQVLCGDCNFGKGSWDETDFREPRLSVVMGEAVE